MLTPSVDALVAELARLPGIGPRSAQRLAFHLLKAPPERPQALAEAIQAVVENIRPCTECFSFAEGDLCPVCADPRRDPTVICVVEEPSAIVSIERTHEFRGRYHVLGGALSPIDGVDPEDLRIAELDQRIERDGVTELVIATNPTMAGEATALFLADRVRDRLRVTRLASGLPVGADLEHADELTLGRALLGRRDI
ncbi:MAG: recombination mediator RecR [Miltoncostaeaceae bacterium]|nr:recombination mediator RecR [Acidobacteriota bacterium]